MIPPRPKDSDSDVIAAAVDKLLPEVIEWLGPKGETKGVREDLLKNIRYSDDGYDFCKRLESDHWTCDSGLVEILDNADGYIDGACRAMVAKWIDAYGITPGNALGATVQYNGKSCEITRIYAKEGHYTLFSEADGHVRSGNGTHGWIVDWEVVDGKVNGTGLTVTGPLFAIA